MNVIGFKCENCHHFRHMELRKIVEVVVSTDSYKLHVVKIQICEICYEDITTNWKRVKCGNGS